MGAARRGPASGTPSRSNRLVNGDGRRSKGWKCLLRVSIKGGNVLWLIDSDGNGLRRERVWSTFQMQSLRDKMSANGGRERPSYRERSSVHEGQYECPMTGKTFDGIKTSMTRGRTQTPSGKRVKDVFVRLRLSPSWHYRISWVLISIYGNYAIKRTRRYRFSMGAILTTPPYATSICTTPLPCLLGDNLGVRPILPVRYIGPERSKSSTCWSMSLHRVRLARTRCVSLFSL